MSLTPTEYSTEAVARAYRYIDDVLDDKLGVGRLERLAVERFMRDWDGSPGNGLTLDPEAAGRVFQFYSFLRHSKGGDFAGKQLLVEGWQAFVLLNLFGWYYLESGRRRFRESYEQVARKNGKSTCKAGTGLYLCAADREPGAEVYSVATKMEQARIVHDEAIRMVLSSPVLKQRIDVFRNNLSIPRTFSKYMPLGGDAKTLDGLNVHGAIVDELHRHPSRLLYDVITTATGARKNPLIASITTAGVNRESICYQIRDYAEKVLTGIIDDDAFFALVCEPDPEDEWFDPSIFRKGNPNLGVSVQFEDLKKKLDQAKNMPGYQNAFRNLHLNEWTNQIERAIDMEVWSACQRRQTDLIGQRCFGGIDLAFTIDIAALVLLFPPEGQRRTWDVVCRFYVPEERIQEAVIAGKVPYDVWTREGWLTATPGSAVDYNVIEEDLAMLDEQYRIVEIGFDRWNSSQIVNNLEGRGFEMVRVGQGWQSMNAPVAEVERLLVTNELNPGPNPVLTWNASNLALASDPAGHARKPDRNASQGKIDGMVALYIAMNRALGAGANLRKRPSKYESSGIEVLR